MADTAVRYLESKLGWPLIEQEVEAVKRWLRQGGAAGRRGKKREQGHDSTHPALSYVTKLMNRLGAKE
eukprot:47598-Eustigmatos_ZCMA.PRE.1